MILSIIIVNYNVKFFLEQCLHSVEKASKNLNSEVWVVDNNSIDGSCQMIVDKFSWVKLIENKFNAGFSYANNQAIKQAKGKYVLLLNPDTIIQEDTLEKIICYMEETQDAGGLGVKMIDGKGKFLPESKRALPTPWVAFYKIFGLSTLFPKSEKFGKYHLSYLDMNKTHSVEILSGAFMLLRKNVLDRIGYLDENFFMYGEDIDLSYRIIKAGYKNYYYPQTTIIHYKGESTKKSSINYVFVFYNAMIIFAKKHFTQKNASIFSTFIKLAIYFRAALSIIKRFLKSIILPLADSIAIYTGYSGIMTLWETVKFHDSSGYPEHFRYYSLPVYILIWLTSVYYSGGYEKPVKLINIIKGLLIGTLIILVGYSLLDESLRFSRILILFGTAWTIISTLLIRSILHFLKITNYQLNGVKKKRIVLVGEKNEIERVKQLLQQTELHFDYIGDINSEIEENTNYIGNINQIRDIIKFNKIDEIIFCSKNISTQSIINLMLSLSDIKVNYKIAPPESLSIIGSNSIHTAGELYVVEINSIAKLKNQRRKRWLDIFLSFNFLLFSFVLVFFVKNKSGFIKNCWLVLTGKKSLVGYKETAKNENIKLPSIKKGVLSPLDSLQKAPSSDDVVAKLNMIYAKNYKIINDFKIIISGFRNLGNF